MVSWAPALNDYQLWDVIRGLTTTLKSVVERTDAWDLSSSDVAPLHRLSSLWPADPLREVLPTQRTCFILKHATAPNLPSLPEGKGQCYARGCESFYTRWQILSYPVFSICCSNFGTPINIKRVKNLYRSGQVAPLRSGSFPDGSGCPICNS